MKKFILMIGLPGSGKSSWAKDYQKSHPHTFIIASDEIRKELFGHVQDFRDEPRIWKTVEERIIEYGRRNDDLTVIVDAGNRNNEIRRHFREVAKDYDVHYLVYLKRDLNTLLTQNKLRSPDRIVEESVIRRFYDEFEEPDEITTKIYKVLLK